MGKVVFEHVTKEFGAVTAVKDFSLEITDKEFIVVVGPSGCGKSTVLRMVAGLESQTAGNIFVGGELVNEKPPRERNIAMVFQNYALYPHMNVYENMAFALTLRGGPKAEIDRKVKEAADILDIGLYLARKPKELSGGQRQRVALGRAIVREPEVFLMDEPLSNLDAKLRVQTRAEIAKLQARLGITTLYVTHDQTEAMTMADRIVVIKDGVIQQIDNPQTLYDNPANRFVAGFIGTPPMNFFACRMEIRDGALILAAPELKVPVPDEWRRTVESLAGREIILGVRPEAIQPSSDEAGQLRSVIDVVEPMGSETYLNLRIGEQRAVIRVASELKVAPDQTLPLTVEPGKIHLFDAVTGLVLAR